jgi:hypothetical protein
MTPTKNSTKAPLERALVYPAIGAVLGTWLGVLPMALDWDRPWQVSHPIVATLISELSSHADCRVNYWLHHRWLRIMGALCVHCTTRGRETAVRLCVVYIIKSYCLVLQIKYPTQSPVRIGSLFPQQPQPYHPRHALVGNHFPRTEAPASSRLDGHLPFCGTFRL